MKKCLSHSHILVHIEPCPGGCDACVVECPKLTVNSLLALERAGRAVKLVII